MISLLTRLVEAAAEPTRRGSLYRIMLMTLMGVTFVSVRGEEPPLLRETIDPNTKGTNYRVVLFDKLILKDGTEYWLDTKSPMKLTRPIELRHLKGERVSFYVFVKQPAGPTQLKVFKIEDIKRYIQWETLAADEVEKTLTKATLASRDLNRLEPLLLSMEQLSGEHYALEVGHFRDRIRVARARLKCASEQSPDVRDEGLTEFIKLAEENLYMPDLEQAFAATHIQFAQEAFKSRQPHLARGYLEKTLSHYPSNQRAMELMSSLRQRAQHLVSEGKEFEQAGKPMDALRAYFSARDLFPQNREILAELSRLQQKYQVLKVAAYEKPGTYEPFNATLPLEKQVAALIFEPLLEPDENGKGLKATALVKSSIQRPGGGGYVFELNPVPFSDQSSLSAQDVAQSLQHWRNPQAEAAQPDLIKYVRDVKMLGPTKLEVLFAPHPRPELLFTFLIAPAHLTNSLPTRGSPFALKPIGSGPFQPAEPLPRADFRLVANPLFREASLQKPYLKEIQFQYVVRQGTGQAVTDLEADRLNMIADPSPNQVLQLQRMPHRYRCRPFLSNNVWILAFNYRNSIFSNPKVREAIYLAIHREKILEQYFGLQNQGQFTHRIITGPFPPQSTAYDSSITPRQTDPFGAKQILTSLKKDPRLGLELQRPIVLKYPTKGDVVLEQAIVQIKKDLVDAGFQIQLAPKLPNDFLREVEHDHDFDLAYCEVRHSNVLYNVEPLFDSDPRQSEIGGTNFMGYRDQTLQQLFVDLRSEQVGDKIWTIQHRIHNYLYTKMVVVPLWRLDRYVAYTTRLKGRTDEGRFVELPVSNAQLFRRTENWYLEPPK